MRAKVYRYQFEPVVDMAEVEVTLVAAILNAEFLYGKVQVRLDAAHAWDRNNYTCAIDASTDVGLAINRLFVGRLYQELDPDDFSVEDAVQLNQTCVTANTI